MEIKSEAIKYDNEKPRMDLLDPDFLEGIAKVLTFGARKYSPNNWRNGFHYSRLISSIYRHLIAFQRGEDYDVESGQSHLYHLGCNVMFLAAMSPELDDRYKGKQNVLSTDDKPPPGSWVPVSESQMEKLVDQGGMYNFPNNIPKQSVMGVYPNGSATVPPGPPVPTIQTKRLMDGI